MFTQVIFDHADLEHGLNVKKKKKSLGHVSFNDSTTGMLWAHRQRHTLLPAARRVARLQVMDDVKQGSDPVLVGCQAGLHGLEPLLQAC